MEHVLTVYQAMIAVTGNANCTFVRGDEMDSYLARPDVKQLISEEYLEQVSSRMSKLLSKSLF